MRTKSRPVLVVLATGLTLALAFDRGGAAQETTTATSRERASVISNIRALPDTDGKHILITMQGSGSLSPKIMKLGRQRMGNLKLVLDFPGALYKTGRVALGSPGLGDIRVVRGAQFKLKPSPVARVVIELKKMVPFTQDEKNGSYTIRLSSAAVAEAEEEPVGGAPAGATTAASAKTPAEPKKVEPKAPAKTVKAAPARPVPVAPAVRPRILHAMVTDLPDRSRLVVTSDGLLRYKMGSRDGGKVLELSIFEVDLKWKPAAITLKEGPIREVRARQVSRPRRVMVTVNLDEARPYHVRRDQNQVIIEVEKPDEMADTGLGARRRGDLLHRVTLNVQNEDLPSLVKALAFEAGFDNVRVNDSLIQGNKKITLSLRGVRFGRALNLILGPHNYIWKVEQGVLRVGRDAEFESELEANALSGGSASSAGSDEGGIVTRVFRLKYITIFDVAGGGVESGLNVVSAGLSAPAVVQTQIVEAVTSVLLSKTKGRVTVDGRSNSLIVTDAASNMSRIARLIKELDVRLPQVSIRAKLIQVNTTSQDALGVIWGAERATPANPELRVTADPGLGGVPDYALTTGMLAPGFNLEAILAVVEKRGEGKVLLSPSITTLHDRAAQVKTSRVTYYEQTIISPGGASGPIISTQYNSVSIPIELTVRPHVNPDDTLQMEVDILMTNVVGGAVAGPPSTALQRATTRLLIRDGETGVIGGMLTDDLTKQVTKVPILGSLPWFLGGALFRSESMTKETLELILFITPTIDKI